MSGITEHNSTQLPLLAPLFYSHGIIHQYHKNVAERMWQKGCTGREI